MHKRIGLVLALLMMSFVRPAAAAKPEDVFKGKIIITKKRLPMKFASPIQRGGPSYSAVGDSRSNRW